MKSGSSWGERFKRGAQRLPEEDSQEEAKACCDRGKTVETVCKTHTTATVQQLYSAEKVEEGESRGRQLEGKCVL